VREVFDDLLVFTEAAFAHFAALYNGTGTHMLNNDQGHKGCLNECPLQWMEGELFNKTAAA
jgi:hypothetical protein